MSNRITHSLMAARRALDDLIADEVALVAIQSAAKVIVDALARRGRVFSCGNGGSMCDAMHFAEELTGRFRKNRVALAAAAIADAAHLSCVANDFGYEHVFSRYLEAHAREGDCLVALSTSGSSKNVVHAAKIAQSLGVHVIGLTGHRDALLAPLCTVHVCTPAGEFSDRVQELHIKVLHILIELVERSMFPENYGADA